MKSEEMGVEEALCDRLQSTRSGSTINFKIRITALLGVVSRERNTVKRQSS
jgi:hypothetical protein